MTTATKSPPKPLRSLDAPPPELPAIPNPWEGSPVRPLRSDGASRPVANDGLADARRLREEHKAIGIQEYARQLWYSHMKSEQFDPELFLSLCEQNEKSDEAVAKDLGILVDADKRRAAMKDAERVYSHAATEYGKREAFNAETERIIFERRKLGATMDDVAAVAEAAVAGIDRHHSLLNDLHRRFAPLLAGIGIERIAPLPPAYFTSAHPAYVAARAGKT